MDLFVAIGDLLKDAAQYLSAELAIPLDNDFTEMRSKSEGAQLSQVRSMLKPRAFLHSVMYNGQDNDPSPPSSRTALLLYS